MRRYFFTFLLFVFGSWTQVTLAQAPVGINYQGVARDLSGVPLSQRNLSIRIAILEGGVGGDISYSETHAVQTNQFGLFTLIIGEGNTSDNILEVDWSSGDKWMQVEMDINGGSNYRVVGAQEFLSVPYALYAAESGAGVEAGEGITISGNEITNSSPDQVVNMLGAGSVTVNGNYPDFTITGIDQVDDADADPQNELQDLEINNNVLSITNNPAATSIDLNNAAGGVIQNVADPVNDNDAATKLYVDNLHSTDLDQDVTNEIQDLSNVLGVSNDAGGEQVKNIGAPVDGGDAVNLTYVNTVEAGLLNAINTANTDYAFKTEYSFQNTSGASTNDSASLDDTSGNNFDDLNVVQSNRFSAPVDGIYFFTIQGESQDNIPISLVVNGNFASGQPTFIQQRFPNASFQNYYGNYLLKLNAGDFVEVIIDSSGLGDTANGDFFGYKL